MPSTPLRATILVVSDTAFHDPSTDRSGAILSDTFAAEGNEQWVVPHTEIVPDDVLQIQSAVLRWCDGLNYVNLVVTTGGTGFAVMDCTPEAIGVLLHRQAPGLVHGMLAASLGVTPFALMSRPVAGVRNKTVIVTLPGSPKGAKENLLAIIKLLPHACILAAGTDSRILHAGGVKQLEKEAGIDTSKGALHNQLHHYCGTHAHNHSEHVTPRAHTTPEQHLKSNNPQDGPARRHRVSPYPMLSVAEALHLVLEQTHPPFPVARSVDYALIGYVLADDVQAKESVPAYRASIVDGYALIVPEQGPSPSGVLPVVSISHANPGGLSSLKPGQISRITTGAALPLGATSVAMVEDTVLVSINKITGEEEEVEILADNIRVNENVREIGSDIQAGKAILRQGEEITAVGGELGLLASVGRAEVMVYEKPVVGVLSTGNEVIPHDRPGDLRLGEVRDSNRPMIMAIVRSWGFEVIDLGIAPDEPGLLESRLRDAMRKVEIIITTGGVSMGELDLLKPTIERSLGGTIHFGRVVMKPGKPTTFATVPFKTNNGERGKRFIFSLPGNPASAIVALHVFVLAALRHMSGASKLGLPKVIATLEHDVNLDAQRPEFHRAVVMAGIDGSLYAASTGPQRSSRVGSLRNANALLNLPARDGVMGKGEKVEAWMMGDIVGLPIRLRPRSPRSVIAAALLPPTSSFTDRLGVSHERVLT